MTPEVGKQYRTRNRGIVRVSFVSQTTVEAECRDGEPVRYAAWPRVASNPAVVSRFDVIALAEFTTATEAGREAARAAMHRRQEIITRGEILDAIDAALRVMNADHTTLHALRRAFE